MVLHIRATALAHLVPCLTTVAAAKAAAAGIADWVGHPLRSGPSRSTTNGEPVTGDRCRGPPLGRRPGLAGGDRRRR